MVGEGAGVGISARVREEQGTCRAGAGFVFIRSLNKVCGVLAPSQPAFCPHGGSPQMPLGSYTWSAGAGRPGRLPQLRVGVRSDCSQEGRALNSLEWDHLPPLEAREPA